VTKSHELVISPGSISVPLRWVAIAGVSSALACLGALVVVASVKDVDTLSTVALALAILAFVIQILIYIAQAWASNEQVRDSQRINAETRGLLAELSTHARDTNEVLRDHYTKIIDKVFLRADETVRDLGAAEGGGAESSEGILAEFREVLDSVRQELKAEAVTARVVPSEKVSSVYASRTFNYELLELQVLRNIEILLPRNLFLHRHIELLDQRLDAVVAEQSDPAKLSPSDCIAVQVHRVVGPRNVPSIMGRWSARLSLVGGLLIVTETLSRSGKEALRGLEPQDRLFVAEVSDNQGLYPRLRTALDRAVERVF
jgi:hypothetical protein